MDPHPLANHFKRSNYEEPIASEFCALGYLYKALLEICESENYDEEIYEEIHDNSFNKKHDCNDFPICRAVWCSVNCLVQFCKCDVQFFRVQFSKLSSMLGLVNCLIFY